MIARAPLLAFAVALLVALVVWLLQPSEEKSQSGRVSKLLEGWRWRGPAPLPFVVLKSALWLCFIATFVTLGTTVTAGRRQPDIVITDSEISDVARERIDNGQHGRAGFVAAPDK